GGNECVFRHAAGGPESFLWKRVEMMHTHIDILVSKEAIGELRVQWNELLCDSQSNCVCLAWEWMYAWWDLLSAGRSLELLLLRRHGRLIGIAPFALRPSRIRRLLSFSAIEFLGEGSVGSDHLDLIMRRGHEQEVMQAIVSHLTRRNKVLQLSHVAHT